MQSNVLTRDKEMISENEGLYGTNKITYTPISLGLAGAEVTHDSGSLMEKSHVSISYDVAQKFPKDKIAEALKPTQSELAQVHGVSNEFKFCQYAKAVEFRLSNLQDVNPTNIEAGIIKELWKEWDDMVWGGSGGNEGYSWHSKGVRTDVASALTFDTLVAETKSAISRIKAVSDITGDELNRLTMVHGDAVTQVLRTFESGSEISNYERFMQSFPNLVMIEAPSNIISDDSDYFLMCLRDGVTLHRASVPAKYGEESGKYGLSKGSLFTYESAGVELEFEGAIQEVTFTGAPATNKKK